MTDYFQKVKKFIDREFKEADRPGHLTHLERTVHWVRELKDEPSEALLIAAYSHDAQHAERWKNQDDSGDTGPAKKDFTDRDRLRKHQDRGAEIVGDFLEKEDAPENLISEVKELISNHEFGGTEDQDILKDADSLSFLENNTESFLDRVGKDFRKEDVREKFDWMYNRISSDRAKKIGLEWYNNAVEELENQ